jgi:hypothetical protein
VFRQIAAERAYADELGIDLSPQPANTPASDAQQQEQDA